jgi:hypothetical protein
MERTLMMTKATLALSAALLFASGTAAVAQFYAPETTGARTRQSGPTISDERYRAYSSVTQAPTARRSQKAGHKPGDTNGF